MTELAKFLARASVAHNPSQRRGQEIMNLLSEVRPDLYAQVTATENDPFYDDSRLDLFYSWLCLNW